MKRKFYGADIMAQDHQNSSGEYLYDAFISYRHKERDIAVAKKLHGFLENYRIPEGYKDKTRLSALIC